MHPRSTFVAVPALAAVVSANPVAAGQVWLDANGDGLPDPNGLQFIFPSDHLTVDIWVDTQSFTFTGYRVTVDRGNWNTVVSASYVIAGGTNLPIDSMRPRR